MLRRDDYDEMPGTFDPQWANPYDLHNRKRLGHLDAKIRRDEHRERLRKVGSAVLPLLIAVALAVASLWWRGRGR
jgi:hypothetical protein